MSDIEFVRKTTGLSGAALRQFVADIAAFLSFTSVDYLSLQEGRWRLRAAALGYSGNQGFVDSEVIQALHFAALAHGLTGHRRKYFGHPYLEHPIEVARLVSSYESDAAVIMAALLHDVVEDTGVPLPQIKAQFGSRVAQLVDELTDVSIPSDGNRAARKAIDLWHTAEASPQAKSIKLADLISNTTSIVFHDSAFARVYLDEKERLLDVLGEGHPKLLAMARESLNVGRGLLAVHGVC